MGFERQVGPGLGMGFQRQVRPGVETQRFMVPKRAFRTLA
jgi:hypothetical protein